MPKPKFVDSDPDVRNTYFTTTKHNDLSQRETLEETMLALGEVLGVKTIKRAKIARGDATIYDAEGGYMSASNVILDMALKLASQVRAQRKQARQERAEQRAMAKPTTSEGC